jgi:polyhydroxyalkanoate synthesis repressor PhaR
MEWFFYNLLQCSKVQAIPPRTAVPSNSPNSAHAARRVIKKYPNRRLYDTDTSTYITLAEVKKLVMEREPVQVIDAKTGDDLTRAILLQIILEEEAGGAPMFTEQALANMIRFYGNTMQSFLGPYLEKNVQTFVDLQSTMGEPAKGMTPEAWAQMLKLQSPAMQGMMGSYVEQSKNVFVQMQEQMQKQTAQMLGSFGLKP